MQIALNGNSTMPYPFLTDLRVARETGYDGVIVVADKLRRYLAEGFSSEQAKAALDGLPVLGLSNVHNIERSGRAELIAECEEACQLAQTVGCTSIQLLTGPHDPSGPYQDPLRMEATELDRQAVSNLRDIGAIGRDHGIDFYVEPLAWTPLCNLGRMVRILEDAGQPNIGLAVDFWHWWNAGTEPDDIARLDGKLIRSIDVCDGIGPAGTRAGSDQRGRRVWIGAGSIPLKEWVDAVRATGYDGTWTCELLSPQHWQLDPWATQRDLRQLMRYLFL